MAERTLIYIMGIIEELIEVLQYSFMQNALIAGLLVALLSGLLGVFIVQRRLSFLGDGLAHVSFGGLALAWFIGIEQTLWPAFAYTLVVSLAIVWLRKNTKLSSDTVIGVLFAISVAAGILLINISEKELQADLMHILFGSILAVGREELYILLVVALIALIFFIFNWSSLAYATFDEELAQSNGIKIGVLEYLLFAVGSLIIVAGVTFVGIILTAANLVIPAASARLLSPSLFVMTILSVLIAIFSVSSGLVVSFFLDVPSGSTIVLVQAGVFFTFLLISTVRKN